LGWDRPQRGFFKQIKLEWSAQGAVLWAGPHSGPYFGILRAWSAQRTLLWLMAFKHLWSNIFMPLD